MSAPSEQLCLACGESYRIVSDSQACPHCLLRIGEDTFDEDGDVDPIFSDRGNGPKSDCVNSGEIGSFVGPYEIVQKLGEGGFGSVFKAEQVEPVRRFVALKMIKLGMDTGQIIARFEAERRALAMMDHPGIARVYDVGSTVTGRPYFAMELVSGEPLGEYCRDHALSIRKRLELFTIVCQAVQHAHQKGIIHRDMKPSNILVSMVDGNPVVKIIDFGIAKAIQRDAPDFTTLTIEGQVFGTPAYMSPEQAGLNEDIDTRCDIYALGMVLYELLAGTLPFDGETARKRDWATWMLAIRQADIDPPSSKFKSLPAQRQETISRDAGTSPSGILRSLRGDLDWITLKALEKDRQLRYASAAELAKDVERHLCFQPITAVAPTIGYTIRKFSRRNRTSLSVACIVLVTLITSTIVSAYYAYEKSLASERAERNYADALLGQVKYLRLAGVAGQRFAALDALERAVAIHNTAEIQSEAITCLSLPDIRDPPPWGTIQDRASSIATASTLASDFSRYARCNGNGVISVRSIVDDNELQALAIEGSTANAEFLLFSPNGRYLAAQYVRDSAFRLRVWDTSSWSLIREDREGFVNRAIAFSPDSEWLAIGRDEGREENGSIGRLRVDVLNLLDASEYTVVPDTPAHSRLPYALAFHPEGGLLAISSDESFNLFVVDWRSGKFHPDLSFNQVVSAFAWHPSGQVMAVATKTQNGSIYLQDLQNAGNRVERIGDLGSIIEIAFSNDGRYFATASVEGAIQLRSAFDGSALVRRQLDGEILTLGFDSSGSKLGIERQGMGPVVWEVEPADEMRYLSSGLATVSHQIEVQFDESGHHLISTSDQGVRVWDWRNSRILGRLNTRGHTSGLAFAHGNGNRALYVTGYGSVLQYRMPSSHATIAAYRDTIGPARTFDTRSESDSGQIEMAVSADGSKFAVLVGDELRLFSPDSFHPIEPNRRLIGATSIAIHCTGEWIAASVESENHIVIQSLTDGESLVDPLYFPGVRRVALSDSSRWLLATSESEIRVYDTNRWTVTGVAHLDTSISFSVTEAFAPSEALVAVATSPYGVLLLGVPDAQVVTRWSASNRNAISSLAFSPSGLHLAAGFDNQEIRIWDLKWLNGKLKEMGIDSRMLTGSPTEEVPASVDLQEWPELVRGVFEREGREKLEKREREAADSKASWLRRGNSFRKLKAYLQTLECCAKAIAEGDASDQTFALFVTAMQGMANYQLNRPELAIANFEEAVRHKEMARLPTETASASTFHIHQVYHHFARMCLAVPPPIGDLDRGRSLAAFALEIPIREENAQLGIGPWEKMESIHYNQILEALVDYRDGNYGEAMLHATRALAIDGLPVEVRRSVDLHSLKAMCYAALDQKAEAIHAYHEASAEWSRAPSAYFHDPVSLALRAEAEEKMGEWLQPEP